MLQSNKVTKHTEYKLKLKTEYIEVLNKSSKSINIKPVVIKAKNKHKQTACEPITNVSKPKPMLPLTLCKLFLSSSSKFSPSF